MRGIIFDLDDTLYCRADFVRSGFHAVARYVANSWRCDHETALATLVEAHATGCEGQEFQVLCSRSRLPLSLVPVLVEMFRGHEPAITLDVAVSGALQKLRAEGWRLVVLTNGDPGVQRRKVAALGIEAFVDGVVYAEEHAHQGKPAAAAFRVALDRLQVSAGRCLCVGDDPIRDIGGARRIGLRTIRIVTPRRHAGIGRDADAVVNAVTDVPLLASSLVPETTHAA